MEIISDSIYKTNNVFYCLRMVYKSAEERWGVNYESSYLGLVLLT
jgi:hypothetical protein